MKTKVNVVLIVAALAVYWAGLCNASAIYNPGTQRWLNRDPKQEQGGINLYEFVRNAPSNLIDLYGLDTITVTKSNGQLEFYGMLFTLLHKKYKSPGPRLEFDNVCPKDHPVLVSATADLNSGDWFETMTDPLRGGWHNWNSNVDLRPYNNSALIYINTTSVLINEILNNLPDDQADIPASPIFINYEDYLKTIKLVARCNCKS